MLERFHPAIGMVQIVPTAPSIPWDANLATGETDAPSA